MKKTKCVFTIVKNEKFFLPIWLEYYKKHFDCEDIFILAHDCDDGSTENLDVNVINIHNDVAFDHGWLLNTVKNFQCKLLEIYEVCVFVEVDEILISSEMDLGDLLSKFKTTQDLVLTCRGYELIHDVENEPSIKNSLTDIRKFRKYYYSEYAYDKTVISKIPLDWTYGFHEVNNIHRNYKYDLILLHLHRVDLNSLIERQVNRSNWNFSNDRMGEQNKITIEQKIRDTFYIKANHGRPSGETELIPMKYFEKL